LGNVGRLLGAALFSKGYSYLLIAIEVETFHDCWLTLQTLSLGA
jgi:hypothetical protein